MDAGLDLNTTKYSPMPSTGFDLILNGQMSQTFSTSGGLFWFKGDSDSASLNPSLNAASLAVTYHGMASSTQKGQGYLNWALSQQDYALGKNPMNAVYTVGLHPNSAQNPQSALASGGTDAANIDSSPPTERWVLYGGLVGGPDKQDNYYDQRSDYEQTEVAIDSNPPLMTLIAYHIQNGDADPFYVSLTQPRVILRIQAPGEAAASAEAQRPELQSPSFSSSSSSSVSSAGGSAKGSERSGAESDWASRRKTRCSTSPCSSAPALTVVCLPHGSVSHRTFTSLYYCFPSL
ncbi:hypothetical protein L7F22_010084 [Adiantum nelumboides]|nr:hypothetical protein [Adiantum nelumboides]